MGIADSLNFHQNKLEFTEEFKEKDLADASVLPKYKQVHWWHDIWIHRNLGARIGIEMIDVCKLSMSAYFCFVFYAMLVTYWPNNSNIPAIFL